MTAPCSLPQTQSWSLSLVMQLACLALLGAASTAAALPSATFVVTTDPLYSGGGIGYRFDANSYPSGTVTFRVQCSGSAFAATYGTYDSSNDATRPADVPQLSFATQTSNFQIITQQAGSLNCSFSVIRGANLIQLVNTAATLTVQQQNALTVTFGTAAAAGQVSQLYAGSSFSVNVGGADASATMVDVRCFTIGYGFINYPSGKSGDVDLVNFVVSFPTGSPVGAVQSAQLRVGSTLLAGASVTCVATPRYVVGAAQPLAKATSAQVALLPLVTFNIVGDGPTFIIAPSATTPAVTLNITCNPTPNTTITVLNFAANSVATQTFTYSNSTAAGLVTCKFVVSSAPADMAAFATPADLKFWVGPKVVLTLGGSLLSQPLIYPDEVGVTFNVIPSLCGHGAQCPPAGPFTLNPTTSIRIGIGCPTLGSFSFSVPSPGFISMNLYNSAATPLVTCTLTLSTQGIRGQLASPTMAPISFTIQPPIFLEVVGWPQYIPLNSVAPPIIFSLPSTRPASMLNQNVSIDWRCSDSTSPSGSASGTLTIAAGATSANLQRPARTTSSTTYCTISTQGPSGVYQVRLEDRYQIYVGVMPTGTSVAVAWTSSLDPTDSLLIPSAALATAQLVFTPASLFSYFKYSSTYLQYNCQPTKNGEAVGALVTLKASWENWPTIQRRVPFNLDPTMDIDSIQCNQVITERAYAPYFNQSSLPQWINYTVVPSISIALTRSPATIFVAAETPIVFTLSLGAAVTAGTNLTAAINCISNWYGTTSSSLLVILAGENSASFTFTARAGRPGAARCTVTLDTLVGFFYTTPVPISDVFIGIEADRGLLAVDAPATLYINPGSASANFKSQGVFFTFTSNASVDYAINSYYFAAVVQISCDQGWFSYAGEEPTPQNSARLSRAGTGQGSVASLNTFSYSAILAPVVVTCSFQITGTDAPRFITPQPIQINFIAQQSIAVTTAATGAGVVLTKLNVAVNSLTEIDVTLSEDVISGLLILVRNSQGAEIASLTFTAGGVRSRMFTYNTADTYTGRAGFLDQISFVATGADFNNGHFRTPAPIAVTVGAPLIKWIESGWPTTLNAGTSTIVGLRIAPASADYTEGFTLRIDCESKGDYGDAFSFQPGSTTPVGGFSDRAGSFTVQDSQTTVQCSYIADRVLAEFEPLPSHMIPCTARPTMLVSAPASLAVGVSATIRVTAPTGVVVTGAGRLFSALCGDLLVGHQYQLLPPGLNTFVEWNVTAPTDYPVGSAECDLYLALADNSVSNPLPFDHSYFHFSNNQIFFFVGGSPVEFTVGQNLLTSTSNISGSGSVFTNAITLTPRTPPTTPLSVDFTCVFGSSTAAYWRIGDMSTRSISYQAAKYPAYVESCFWSRKFNWAAPFFIGEFAVGGLANIPSLIIEGLGPWALAGSTVLVSARLSVPMSTIDYLSVTLSCSGGATVQGWPSYRFSVGTVLSITMPWVATLDVLCSFTQAQSDSGFGRLILPPDQHLQVDTALTSLQLTPKLAIVAPNSLVTLTLSTVGGQTLVAAGGVTVTVSCTAGSVPSSPFLFPGGSSSVSFNYQSSGTAESVSCAFSFAGPALAQLVLPLAASSFVVAAPSVRLEVRGVPTLALATGEVASITLTPSAPVTLAEFSVAVGCSFTSTSGAMSHSPLVYLLAFPAGSSAPQSFNFVAPTLTVKSTVTCSFRVIGAAAAQLFTPDAVTFNVAATCVGSNQCSAVSSASLPSLMLYAGLLAAVAAWASQ